MAKGHSTRYHDHMSDRSDSVAETRHDRRKAATRAALVRAARELLVEVGSEVSVQAITDRADVALGSFYNHFPDKPAVFAAAATDALLEFEDHLIARTEHVHPRAAVFAARMRLYGRMRDSHPDIAAVIVSQPPSAEAAPHGYSLRALADAQDAVAEGEIRPQDLDIRLIAATGSLRHLMLLRHLDPSIPPERVDDMVELLLGTFGVAPDQAREWSHGPLPV
jgi:AcrR family transcriptional regulator